MIMVVVVEMRMKMTMTKDRFTHTCMHARSLTLVYGARAPCPLFFLPLTVRGAGSACRQRASPSTATTRFSIHPSSFRDCVAGGLKHGGTWNSAVLRLLKPSRRNLLLSIHPEELESSEDQRRWPEERWVMHAGFDFKLGSEPKSSNISQEAERDVIDDYIKLQHDGETSCSCSLSGRTVPKWPLLSMQIHSLYNLGIIPKNKHLNWMICGQIIWTRVIHHYLSNAIRINLALFQEKEKTRLFFVG